jgi:hypothetical protein
MRINRSVLLKNARNAVAELTYHDHSLICAYLTGSLLSDDPMLGGTTDIDLICVHTDTPAVRREVARITDEVHLDIAHYPQADYAHLRELRQDPWLGSYLCERSIVYHDVQHWFEFTQASVCAQFMRPDHILQRAQPLIENARKRWIELGKMTKAFSPPQVRSYLKAIENAANAIAILNGPPLTERRFLLKFEERVKAIGRPGLSAGLEELFYQPVTLETWKEWLDGFQQAFVAACKVKESPPWLKPFRLPYYKYAAVELFNQHPTVSAWIVLRSWTDAMCYLTASDQHIPAWQKACQELLLGEDQYTWRLDGLDAYLDSVEEALDAWAEENGTESLTELG